MSIAVEDLQKDFADEEGVPSLPTAAGLTTRPSPGVYARGMHVIAVAGEISAAAVGTGGARGVKRIESAMEELGVKPVVGYLTLVRNRPEGEGGGSHG